MSAVFTPLVCTSMVWKPSSFARARKRGRAGWSVGSPSLDRPRHFGLAELGLEIGVQTEAGPFMGVGLKWVVIGYPTETVANSLIPKLVIGVAF